MQLVIHPSHLPWGVDWNKISLIIEIKLLLLLITCIETSWHSSCQLIPKNWISPLVSWPCFALGQNWLSEGFGLFSSPSQNFLFCYLTMMPSLYFRFFPASPCSSTVCISPWQMAGLCVQPWNVNSRCMDSPTSESKLWPALCHQRDWEKSISDISCALPLGCLCPKFLLKGAGCTHFKLLELSTCPYNPTDSATPD